MREDRKKKAEGKRSGLGVTLLRSVSVNLAELRREQTRADARMSETPTGSGLDVVYFLVDGDNFIGKM